MAVPFPLRVMQMIRDELATIPALGLASLDLSGYQQLPKSKYPAVFVVRSSGGQVEALPPDRLRLELLLLITGFVLAPGATSVTDARETLYGAVENVLLGSALQARFLADFEQTGQQALPVELDSGPDTDEGQAPPFGYFTLPTRVILHYTRGTL